MGHCRSLRFSLRNFGASFAVIPTIEIVMHPPKITLGTSPRVVFKTDDKRGDRDRT